MGTRLGAALKQSHISLRPASGWCYSSGPHLDSFFDNSSTLGHLHQIYGFMVVRGLREDDHLLSRLIRMSASLGFTSYAHSLFTQNASSCSTIFVYNSLIKALNSSSQPARAILLFNTIRRVGLRPDSYSFPYVLKAVVRLSAVSEGRQIHCQAIATGLDSHVSVATALVQMYSSCGCALHARKLFDGVIFRNHVPLWNAMVAGYVKLGHLKDARLLFESMPQRNVISWTALIAGYAQTNRPNEAIMLFRRMQLQNVQPDEIAILAVLSACADLGALELGEWIHKYIENHALHKTVSLCNVLIDMYAKSGNISKALQTFEDMKQKTVITWTTMIAGLSLHGLGIEALQMFKLMEMERIQPNEITFIAILSACSHVGLVKQGRWYFVYMKSRYGIQPTIEHYGCMVDLLGRAGCLQEAKELICSMPFEANAAIWGSLLAASNKQDDAELGARALCHLIKLESGNSGNYVLLSNMYAALGKWNDSSGVRKFMRDMGVRKTPGVSFIEMNSVVHEFIAGDISNSHFHCIYMVLSCLSTQLKMTAHLHYDCSCQVLEFDG